VDAQNAVNTCPDQTCACPVFSASGSACGACLVSDGNGVDFTLATYVTQFLAIRSQVTTPTTASCQSQCEGLNDAAMTCFDNQCWCRSLSASLTTCSACLMEDGDALDSAYAQYLSAYAVTSCVHGVTIDIVAPSYTASIRPILVSGPSATVHLASSRPSATFVISGCETRRFSLGSFTQFSRSPF